MILRCRYQRSSRPITACALVPASKLRCRKRRKQSKPTLRTEHRCRKGEAKALLGSTPGAEERGSAGKDQTPRDCYSRKRVAIIAGPAPSYGTESCGRRKDKAWTRRRPFVGCNSSRSPLTLASQAAAAWWCSNAGAGRPASGLGVPWEDGPEAAVVRRRESSFLNCPRSSTKTQVSADVIAGRRWRAEVLLPDNPAARRRRDGRKPSRRIGPPDRTAAGSRASSQRLSQSNASTCSRRRTHAAGERRTAAFAQG